MIGPQDVDVVDHVGRAVFGVAEDEQRAAKLDAVAVLQRLLLDTLVVDERAVRAVEIAEDEDVVFPPEFGMSAGNLGIT